MQVSFEGRTLLFVSVAGDRGLVNPRCRKAAGALVGAGVDRSRLASTCVSGSQSTALLSEAPPWAPRSIFSMDISALSDPGALGFGEDALDPQGSKQLDNIGVRRDAHRDLHILGGGFIQLFLRCSPA